MILDFAKKHWKMIYLIEFSDLLSIIIINKFVCHESIKYLLKLFCVSLFIWTLEGIYEFKWNKIKKTGKRKEGSMLMFLAGSIYASVKFFINPMENNYWGAASFLWLPENLCAIFFARKYGITGVWFKKEEWDLR